MMNNKKEKYQQFCLNLTERYLQELSGEGENSEFITDSRPSEKVLIGILDSGIGNDEATRYTSMPMVKVQFFVDSTLKGDLKISISGNLYYNVLPTYEEEIQFVNKQKDEINKRKVTGSEEEDNQDELDDNRVQIMQKFKKVSVKEIWKDIVISKKELLEKGEVDFSDTLNKRLYDGYTFEDSVFFSEKTINEEVLKSRESYEDYLNKHSGTGDCQIIKSKPYWKFYGVLTSDFSSKEDLNVVTLLIENVTEKSQDYNAKRFETKRFSIPLYNVEAQIEALNGFEFKEIELENFENSYKVHSKVKAKGEWLSAECVENKIITKNIPRYIEKRLITTEKYNDNTNFHSLQEHPIDNLKEILKGMKEYYKTISSRNINDEKFFEDLKKFKYEITRFEKGITLLEDTEFISIKKAFICMNKTFERILKEKSNCWRLFQLVFIVSMIPDIVFNENKDILESEIYNYNDIDTAEIIYFPTGGGKTEAFLGTVILSCFYDRFIGKKYGVNTMIKYPLRLLSIQQLERTLEAIEMANQVLKENDEIKELPIFTLGYFVGSSNTPNIIKDSDIEKYEHKTDYILIEYCPVCGEKIDVVFNRENRVLEHKCTKCGNVLPLYIVDDEIYRFLPSVLIGTIDKLATISLNDGFRNILGGSKYRCPIHGFTHNYKCQWNINDKVENVYDSQVPSLAPTLFIQDEIHLLKESLGVFSSHYESLLEFYMKELIDEKHRKRIKYIGATATISGADSLINELYGKGCRIFPSPSTYSNGETFYSKLAEDDIARIIIGFAPFGDSINARIEYVVSHLRLLLYTMYNHPEKYASEYQMDEEDFKKMVFYYWTTIIYFRSKNDNNKIRNTFEQQANDGRLIDEPNARFNIVRMTGDENFSQIKSMLNSMMSERNKMKTHNMVLATSTISHGVDSSDFNNIFFYGIPSNTAEYIQSYSRVGRTYTGLVVDIIRLARNRNVSFLKYFNLMHSYKDYLIDETRLNSKSSIAMYRTLPGILISLLKHYYSVKDNRKYETLGDLNSFFADRENISDLFNKLCTVYRCEDVVDESSIDAQFKKNIKKEIQTIVKNTRQIVRESLTLGYSFSDNINRLTTNNYKAMTSLRDVDINYEIGIDFRGDNDEEE